MSNFGDVFLDGVINEVLVSQKLNTVFGRNCQEQRHIFMELVFSDKDLVCGRLALKKSIHVEGPSVI